MYCGSKDKLPKGKVKHGSLDGCTKARQVRLWGKQMNYTNSGNMAKHRLHLNIGKAMKDGDVKPKLLFTKDYRMVSKGVTGSGAHVFHIPFKSINKSMILKLTPIDMADNVDFEHEQKIYDIVSEFVSRYISPCVLKNFYITNNLLTSTDLPSSVLKAIGGNELSMYHALCLETYGNQMKTLRSHKNSDWTIRQTKSILFQLLYTLQCFLDCGLIQNDLHHENIFIEELKLQGNYYKEFIYNKKSYYIPVNGYHAKIFDFDRALSLKSNAKAGVHGGLIAKHDQKRGLAYFEEYYRVFDNKRDLLRLLLPFMSGSYNINFQNVAQNLFNLNHYHKNRTSLSKSITNKCSEYLIPYNLFIKKDLKAHYPISDEDCPTVLQCIKSGVFDELRVRPDDCIVIETYNADNIMEGLSKRKGSNLTTRIAPKKPRVTKATKKRKDGQTTNGAKAKKGRVNKNASTPSPPPFPPRVPTTSLRTGKRAK